MRWISMIYVDVDLFHLCGVSMSIINIRACEAYWDIYLFDRNSVCDLWRIWASIVDISNGYPHPWWMSVSQTEVSPRLQSSMNSHFHIGYPRLVSILDLTLRMNIPGECPCTWEYHTITRASLRFLDSSFICFSRSRIIVRRLFPISDPSETAIW